MLHRVSGLFVYSFLQLNPESKLAQALHFFVYDSVKILVLLFSMIAVVGFLRTFISQRKIKHWIAGKKSLAHVFASVFGSITPFCSCSSIPLFMGFLEAGIPLGVAFSFLVTSPLVNEYVAIIMLGFFGWKITLLYVLSGILIGVMAGMILGRMNLERYLVQGVVSPDTSCVREKIYRTVRDRAVFGVREAMAITKKLWPWILVGVGIGAAIHNYVPEETVHAIISRTGAYSVPLATLLGMPIYGSCAAIVPVAVALFNKGLPLGTALAFMMATAALSLPEAVILRRVMKLRLIALFFGITALGIVITGYVFNFVHTVW